MTTATGAGAEEAPEPAEGETAAPETAAPEAPATAEDAATDGWSVHGAAAAAVQAKDVDGSEEKFEEYRDVPRGFVLDQLRVSVGSPVKPAYLDFEAIDALQDDELYRLRAGWHGKLRLSVVYDVTPHNFSDGQFLWDGFGSRRLRIADVVQSSLEANEQTQAERGPTSIDPNQDTTGEDAIQQSIVRGLYDAAEEVVFRLERKTTDVALEYTPTPNTRLWARVRNENRDGARVMTIGTYERWAEGSGLAHVQDRFLVSGADLAEPLDYRTFRVSAGAGAHGDRWLADLEYDLVLFENVEGRLIWDNPFRITDAAATGASGGFDRGRFARGQIDLVPDSQAHELTLSGAVHGLPWRGLLAADAGVGFVVQDDRFLPFTLNTAIEASDEAGSLGPAASLALPRRDLAGTVLTVAGGLSLSLQPADIVGVSARYRYYRYDDRSGHVSLPGYAAFSESFWRRVRNDPGAPVEREPFDFDRQNAELAVDVRLLRPLTVSVAPFWVRYGYDGLRIDHSNEYGGGGSIAYRAARHTRISASYRFGYRDASEYMQGQTPENPEARGLVNFNWADRRRHRARVRAQVTPSSVVSFGLSAAGVYEDYDGDSEGDEVIDEFRYGRTNARSAVAAADVTLTPNDRLSFFGTYAYEYRREVMLSAAKDDPQKDPNGLGDQFPELNAWRSRIREGVNTVGVGATAEILADRLVLDAIYYLSLSNMDIDNSNPNGVRPETLLNAIAIDWPDIRNRFHSVNASLAYALSPQVRVGLQYLFEWYDLDDFAWDLLEPYMAGRSVENSTRFVFADATYSGYEAHVGRIFVAASF